MMPRNSSVNSFLYWYNKWFSSVASLAMVYFFYSKGCTTCFFVASAFFLYFAGKAMPRLKRKDADKYNAVVVGGGVSGLNAGKCLAELGIKYVILEKRSHLGGTWWDNKYPGAACDVPSHLYSFSFYPNPWWSKNYSEQKEILWYLEDMACHYRIYPNIVFNKEVKTATWDDKDQKWTVTCTDGEQFQANFLISGNGALRVPHVPDFKGMADFQGTIMHSAEWKSDVELKDKKVAVVGTGASAVQIVPNIAGTVKKLHVFQRTPCWVPPRLGMKYSTYQQILFALIPPLRLVHRWIMFWKLELGIFPAFDIKNTKASKRLLDSLTTWMSSALRQDPDLLRRLIPTYPIGCKRITPSDTYLQAYLRDNVHLVTSKIEKFTSKGIKTANGEEVEADVVILATGFDVEQSFKAYKVFGRFGKVLHDEWGDAPFAYKGTIMPNFPNLFFLLGPNTGLGHNSIIYIIECQCNYIVDCITNLVKTHGSSMDVKTKVLEKYLNKIYSDLKNKVWSTSCLSWYKNSRGIIWTLWPYDLTKFWWINRRSNLAEYNVKE